MAIWILWSFPVAGSTFHPHGFCEATNWWHSETVKLLPTLKHTNSDEILSRKYSKTTEVDQSLKCHEMAPKCCTGNISKYQTKNCSELPECPAFSLKVANAHGTSSANFGSREKVPCWKAVLLSRCGRWRKEGRNAALCSKVDTSMTKRCGWRNVKSNAWPPQHLHMLNWLAARTTLILSKAQVL